jgi:hypothetical protein
MKASVRNRAARLYSLALVAHLDAGETAEETAVVERAVYDARKALAAEGYEPRELVTLPQCIEVAKSEAHR